jgi:hypothetical protein
MLAMAMPPKHTQKLAWYPLINLEEGCVETVLEALTVADMIEVMPKPTEFATYAMN